MVGRRLALLFLSSLLVLAAACDGGAETPPDPTSPAVAEPSPQANAQPTETPATQTALERPDGNRILEYARQLSQTIGPRVAGTPNEKAAADYIAEQLRSFGYEVELQDFAISEDAGRDSALSVRAADSQTIPSVPFQGSAAGNVQGPLIAVPGLGEPRDFPASARGAIVLIERGELLFRDKIANARAAGATGVIISNNETGLYYGSLGESTPLPAVAISQTEGQKLRSLAAAGSVTAQLSVDVLGQSTSYNVVAKPPGQECETVSGGHYDSVPQAPGANDNASGTATVLEIASILADGGRMGNNCFVLFGAEELGLLGSQAYVAGLNSAARNQLKAMLNFDMVGVGDQGWQLIGSAALQDRAGELANSLGIATSRSRNAGTGAGSDHASFIQAGIPAIFLHRTSDSAWHTPQDSIDRLRPELLEAAARLGLALLESLDGA
jgi:aminopeptidase YwaD